MSLSWSSALRYFSAHCCERKAATSATGPRSPTARRRTPSQSSSALSIHSPASSAGMEDAALVEDSADERVSELEATCDLAGSLDEEVDRDPARATRDAHLGAAPRGGEVALDDDQQIDVTVGPRPSPGAGAEQDDLHGIEPGDDRRDEVGDHLISHRRQRGASEETCRHEGGA